MVDYLQDAIAALKTVIDEDTNVVPVWYCKVAENWKAILINDDPEDCCAIYEVTRIGAEKKTVIDRYGKTKKTIIKDEGER